MPLTKKELDLFNPPTNESINWQKLLELALAKKIATAAEQKEFVNAVLGVGDSGGILFQAHRQQQKGLKDAKEFINVFAELFAGLSAENLTEINRKGIYLVLLANAIYNEEPFINLNLLPDGFFDASFGREFIQTAGIGLGFIELVLKKIDFTTVDANNAPDIISLALHYDDLETFQLLENELNKLKMDLGFVLSQALKSKATRIALYLGNKKNISLSSEERISLADLAISPGNKNVEILEYVLEFDVLRNSVGLYSYINKLFELFMEIGDDRLLVLVEKIAGLKIPGNNLYIKNLMETILLEKMDKYFMLDIITELLKGKNFNGVMQAIVSDVITAMLGGTKYVPASAIFLSLIYDDKLKYIDFSEQQLLKIVDVVSEVSHEVYPWPCMVDLLNKISKKAFVINEGLFVRVFIDACRSNQYDVLNLLVNNGFNMGVDHYLGVLKYLYERCDKDIDDKMLQYYIGKFISFEEIRIEAPYKEREIGCELCLRLAAHMQDWHKVAILVQKMYKTNHKFNIEHGSDLVVGAVRAQQWEVVETLMETIDGVQSESVYNTILLGLARSRKWEIIVKILTNMPKEFQVDYKVLQLTIQDPTLKNEYQKKQILKLLAPHLQHAQYTNIKYLPAKKIIIPNEDLDRKLSTVYHESRVTGFDAENPDQYYKQIDRLMDEFSKLYNAQLKDKSGKIPEDKKFIERAGTGFVARVPDSQGVTYWSYAYSDAVDAKNMNPFEMFKDIIGNQDYFTNDEPERINTLPALFKQVKSGLEELYFMLLSDDVDDNKKVNALNSLSTQLIKCGPGITESIEFCRNMLSVGDLKVLLAQHRENLLNDAAISRRDLVRQLHVDGVLKVLKNGRLYIHRKRVAIADDLLDVLVKIIGNQLPEAADELAKFNKSQVELFDLLGRYCTVLNTEYEVHVIAAYIIEGQKLGLNLPSGPNTVEHQGVFLPSVYKDINENKIQLLVQTAIAQNFPNNIETVSGFIKKSFISDFNEIWPAGIGDYSLEKMKTLNMLLYRNGLAEDPEVLNEKLVKINDDYTQVVFKHEMLDYCIAESLGKNGFIDANIYNNKSSIGEELNYFILGNNVYLNITDKDENESVLYNQAAIRKILTDATELNIEIIMAAIVSFSKANPQIINIINKVQMPIDNKNLLSLAKIILSNNKQQDAQPTMLFGKSGISATQEVEPDPSSASPGPSPLPSPPLPSRKPSGGGRN